MNLLTPSQLRAVALAHVFVAASAGAGQAPRDRARFDTGWRFHLGGAPAAESVAFDDSAWLTLNLPHDWRAAVNAQMPTPNPDYNPAAPAATKNGGKKNGGGQ